MEPNLILVTGFYVVTFSELGVFLLKYQIWYRYEVMTFQFLDLEKSEEAAENYCVLGNFWYEW